MRLIRNTTKNSGRGFPIAVSQRYGPEELRNRKRKGEALTFGMY